MGLTADQLKASLDALAAREPLIAAAIGRVGYPRPASATAATRRCCARSWASR